MKILNNFNHNNCIVKFILAFWTMNEEHYFWARVRLRMHNQFNWMNRIPNSIGANRKCTHFIWFRWFSMKSLLMLCDVDIQLYVYTIVYSYLKDSCCHTFQEIRLEKYSILTVCHSFTLFISPQNQYRFFDSSTIHDECDMEQTFIAEILLIGSC